jgi:HEXXH motif-containing protein
MAAGPASEAQRAGRISALEASFDPCAARARRLDARMRARLADSVRYVASQVGAHLRIDAAALERFLARVAAGPVRPHAFAAYCDLVLALDADDLDAAGRCLEALFAVPAASELRIEPLGDAARDPDADRIRRHVDSDPEQPIELRTPPPDVAAACRARIDAALGLLDAGHPALAAEIRALVREIVLAVGSDRPDAWGFDGASSFMLWGAIVLNASGHATRLETVQALAHESAHNLLFGLCADGPLVENDGALRYASPLRVDPRPIDGIYHATFVTARMHQALAHLRDAGALEAGEREEAERALAANRELFAQGLATLERHARLTPLGAAALAGARAHIAEWETRRSGS